MGEKKQKSSNHNQITNFKITELSQGPMFILYKDQSTTFIQKLPLFVNRIDDRLSDFTQKSFKKIIIINDINLEFDGNYTIMNNYISDEIDKIKEEENIIIVDINCVSDENLDHFIEQINDFKPNKTCIVVLINETSPFVKNLNMADHIMLTKDVSDNILGMDFKQHKLRDL